jgi:hypothetical protein
VKANVAVPLIVGHDEGFIWFTRHRRAGR